MRLRTRDNSFVINPARLRSRKVALAQRLAEK